MIGARNGWSESYRSSLITLLGLLVLPMGGAAAQGFDHQHAAFTARQERILDRKAEIRFLEYDWALNDTPR